MDRRAAVAGSFYPANPKALRVELDRCLGPAAEPITAIGCIVPHAGYVYSGEVAGAVFGRMEQPESVILLGPNHNNIGPPFSILTSGRWETPLGPIAVNEALATALLESHSDLTEDSEAHRLEHSLEVQLPFIRRLWPSVRFVPIVVGCVELPALESLGSAIARVLVDFEPKPLLVASSDMNHYESDSISRDKDKLALDQIMSLDAEGLFQTVREHRISMCGYGPVVSMLTTAQMLGATKAELLRYANSGEVTGDTASVVGYAGIAIT